jgi:predicted ATPase
MDQEATKAGSGVASQAASAKLISGTQFGRYEILGPLGAGGMGEVYRARDLRLGRELAIKILSSKLSPTQESLERFEREASTASTLNHPNIVTIFELGQAGPTYYIAMELVEGKLLREMLEAGALALDTAISIATQIADGLAKAHEAGVVHRDLKPENLMVTRDGLVKILDFGLAKLTAARDGESADASTQDGQLTSPGMILGTIEYLSPEQANGLPVDFRSDQFSLGSVLYEMVTGKRTFRRRSHAETIAAILRDNPEPVATVNPQVPAPLCWVIERCLAKAPEERYGSTREIARELATIRNRLSEAPSRYSPVQQSNLPVQRTAFIGREEEVKAIQELLLGKNVNLLTLTGPGGIGKTRLALRVAGEVGENFPGGVCYVALGGVGDTGLVPSLIAQALGISESRQLAATEKLKGYLQDARANLLLILDNFEHLLSAAPFVAQLLTISSKLRLIVTSRAPLHLYGEHEFPVPPLALPDVRAGRSIETLAKNPAIALFIERATAVKPNFELAKENAEAVAAICARLEGLPLAIELAAVRIKFLTPAAMEARLESRLQLLTGGAKDLPERQQTLRGAIDWSYSLLNAAEQTLFRRMSVFAGGCTLEGVEAVCNSKEDLEVDIFEGVASLVDKSLVQQIERPGEESRFSMLDTIREFGLESLAASGEEQAMRKGHAAYCLVLAEEYATPSADRAQTDWVNLYEVENDNFRAALKWLIRTGNGEWGMRLGTALFQFWDAREYLTEGRDQFDKLLKLEGAKGRTNTRARALFSAGVLAEQQGDYESASALFTESLEIARELKDARGTGIALNALATAARDRGDPSAARSLFEESLKVWGDLGDRAMVARSLSNLANVVKLEGDAMLARSLFAECHLLFRELGDRTGMARSLNFEADVAQGQGEAAAARALYEESLAISRELGDTWGMAACFADLGSLARGQKDYEACRKLYAESLKLFQELGNKRGIARLLDCLACSAAAQSKPERSLRLAGTAAALRHALGAPLPAAEQAQLEEFLEAARRSLPQAAAASAWIDGWATPVEKAIEWALGTDA